MKLAPREREALHRRLALAFLWSNVSTVTDTERVKARRMATTVIETLEEVATSRSTLDRAIVKVVARAEEIA